MTSEGHLSLKEELLDLKSRRPAIAQMIETAREHGDLKENAEYHAAKEKQGMMEGRISVIEDQITRADVIDITKLSGDKIRFGATVELEDVDSGETVVYQILGPIESDVEKGILSVTSPVARALIGKEPGDEVVVKTPGGSRSFEVIEVRWGGN